MSIKIGTRTATKDKNTGHKRQKVCQMTNEELERYLNGRKRDATKARTELERREAKAQARQ